VISLRSHADACTPIRAAYQLVLAGILRRVLGWRAGWLNPLIVCGRGER
jgi:hypothetical protein